MAKFPGFGPALWTALSKGLDVLISVLYGRPGKPDITPAVAQGREPALNNDDAAFVADLAQAEQDAGKIIEASDPDTAHPVDIVPVNEPLGGKMSPGNRLRYEVEVGITRDGSNETRPIRVSVESPYPLSKEEIMEAAMSQVGEWTDSSPGAFIAGAGSGEIIVVSGEILSVVRVF